MANKMTEKNMDGDIGRKASLSDISPRLKRFFKHGIKRAFVKHPFIVGFGASLAVLQAMGMDATAISSLVTSSIMGMSSLNLETTLTILRFKNRISNLKKENSPAEAKKITGIISQMRDNDIANLPAQKLYKYLCAGLHLEVIRETIQTDRLLKNSKLDGRFLADNGQRAKSFFDWFSNSKEMDKGTKDWKKLSKFERLEILQNITDHYCKVLGHDTIPVYSFKEGKHAKGHIRMASFNQHLVEIDMNTHELAGWDEFAHTASSLIHELTHYGQYCLAKDMRDGKLPETDPRYIQAKIFEFNFLKYRGDKGVYENQPLEKHAYMRGKDAMMRVFIYEQAGPISKLDDLFKIIEKNNKSPKNTL